MIWVGKPRAMLRKLDPSQDGFHSARLVVYKGGYTEVELNLMNREVYGVWLMQYAIVPRGFAHLLVEGFIEFDESQKAGGEVYVLSAKGKKRLRIS